MMDKEDCDVCQCCKITAFHGISQGKGLQIHCEEITEEMRALHRRLLVKIVTDGRKSCRGKKVYVDTKKKYLKESLWKKATKRKRQGILERKAEGEKEWHDTTGKLQRSREKLLVI